MKVKKKTTTAAPPTTEFVQRKVRITQKLAGRELDSDIETIFEGKYRYNEVL